MKKVSVIIPCFNQELYIEETVKSVLAQTYPEIEIIVIDDCSTDNSTQIVNNLISKNKNITLIKNQSNMGVIFSRNNGISNAAGEYILPLDGDDKIAPSYIEKAVKILESDETIGMVYCKSRFFGLKNKKCKIKPFSIDEILHKNCIFVTALFRKSTWEKVGGFKEYMKYGLEDWDFWLSVLENGLRPYCINEILFFYRKQNNSRNNTFANRQYELWQNIIKNHLDLYLSNKSILDRIFYPFPQKAVKYKKYFKYTLTFAILEAILICILLFYYMFIKT